jgi:hypothetical protein
MKNLSYRTDHLCELATALLIWGIQMGEMSRRGWLFGLVGRFLVFPCTLEYRTMDKVQKAGNSKLTGVFVMLFGSTLEMFFSCPCCFTIAAILVTFSTVLFVNFRRP